IRLLKVASLQFEEHRGDTVPAYAILSHRWYEPELSFRKIKDFCYQASEQGIEYVWVDTCCIDKSSSVELQESLNSMQSWYAKSAVCFAYLRDVDLHHVPTRRASRSPNEGQLNKSLETSFKKSNWFTRGWTLQELVAPRHLIFFDRQWAKLAMHEKFIPRSLPSQV
ncbi:heterokaryon incompatibility protein-domain-containing protein, partial [Microdochium trichocladiopsis]